MVAPKNNLTAKLDELARRYSELNARMGDPEVTRDPQQMMALGKELARLGKIALPYRDYQHLADQAEQARGLMEESDEPEMRELARADYEESSAAAENMLDELKAKLVMSDEDTIDSVMMEIRAGTGGDEAALFARALLEMYTRYAERRGWKQETLSISPTELGGVREVILNVKGEGVWRELGFEGGGHRVQRVPETEAQGRIHTSAATVAVLPERDDVEIDIDWDQDVEEQTMRASGPGGQNVNKVESAIRLRHIETGITVSMQDEKSQHKNRAKARRILMARVQDHYLSQQQSEEAAARKLMIGSGDRSQRIRTYNFPQNRCTDHRIGYNANLQQIMAGDLENLINALLADETARRLTAL